MIIKGKTYDTLKFFAQVLLPVIGALYFILSGIGGLPAPEQVVGIIVTVDAFLGVVLHISSNRFSANTGKGAMNILPKPNSDGLIYQLEFDGDPSKEIEGKDRVLLDVKNKA